MILLAFQGHHRLVLPILKFDSAVRLALPKGKFRLRLWLRTPRLIQRPSAAMERSCPLLPSCSEDGGCRSVLASP